MGTSNTLQDSFNFFFLLVIYIPVNIILMLLAAVFFSATNKMVGLHFPSWVVAFAAGLFVFAFMYSFQSGVASKRTFGGNPETYYTATAIVNIIVVLLMLTMAGLNRLIFKSGSGQAFSFGTPQMITTAIYVVLTGAILALPLLNENGQTKAETKREDELRAVKEAIDTDDITRFEKLYSNRIGFFAERFPTENISVFAYLLSHNKISMVQLLIADSNSRQAIFTNVPRWDWDITSTGMMAMLVQNGLDHEAIVEILTNKNETALAKEMVLQYHPVFTNKIDWIAQNLVANNNMELLHFLVQHGLVTNTIKAREVTTDLVMKNKTDEVKMLVKGGFPIDTANHEMVKMAISHNNLPLLNLLFQYPFDINYLNEYTYVEAAVLGSSNEVIAFLLSQKPDVTTLHKTHNDGMTNAVMLAEKNKNAEAMAMLQKYVGEN